MVVLNVVTPSDSIAVYTERENEKEDRSDERERERKHPVPSDLALLLSYSVGRISRNYFRHHFQSTTFVKLKTQPTFICDCSYDYLDFLRI